MQESILSLKNVTKHFGGVAALENVSFDVAENEIPMNPSEIFDRKRDLVIIFHKRASVEN